MRIGVDIRPLMKRPYFGVGRYTFCLLDNLFRIDRENEYFLFYNSFKPVENYLPKWQYPNVKFIGYRWPNKIFNFSQKFFHQPKIDRLVKGGVDLFFLPNQHFVSLSDNCFKVITVHDLVFEKYPEFFSPKRRIWHKLVNLRALVKKFDKIISVSQSTREDLINYYGLSADKISVIYSGLIKRKISEEIKERVKKKYNLPSKFFFFLGRLEPRKNISGLIIAFDELLDDFEKGKIPLPHLIVAGGRGWLGKNIYQTLKRIKHKNKIRFLGYLSEEEKFAFYHLATLFIYPSFYEGFGFPVLEAMSCGCPIITSFSSSLPEVVGRAGFLIDPNNLSDLKSAMNELFLDVKLREELKSAGLLQSQKFDWSETARKVLEVFKEARQGK